MAKRKTVLELDEYNIHFQEDGRTTGYWFVFQRVGDDYETKAKAGIESTGYREKIIELNKFSALYEMLCSRNIPVDALIAQYEAALILQYIAHHIIKKFKVNIIRDGHTADDELPETDEDKLKNDQVSKLVVVAPASKGN